MCYQQKRWFKLKDQQIRSDQCTQWLNVVEECKIHANTKLICDSLQTITLPEDEEIISFDVSSLYTNVPVMEAINICADLLYSGKYPLPPVDKETFVELLKLSTCNVLMQTHHGFYRQVDGLAMGSPPASLLSNGWLNKFDSRIKDDARLYFRFMDDIIRNINKKRIDEKLAEINIMHKNLKFTIEREQDGSLPFLDMRITRDGGKLSSSWYNKPTDTGLILNYHSVAPKRYKKSVVAGFVHRIHRACSSYKSFHQSLSRAQRILEMNQYPPTFYQPIINETITKILTNTNNDTSSQLVDPVVQNPKKMIFLQYRGRETDNYCRSLQNCGAPVTPILTIRKLKTVLPSLKPKVDHKVRSGVVYCITCPRCESCYVGWTSDHICTRLQHHKKPSQPVGKHLRTCGSSDDVTVAEVKILAATTRNEQYGLTLEAIWQEILRPKINVKEEFKSRKLTIML